MSRLLALQIAGASFLGFAAVYASVFTVVAALILGWSAGWVRGFGLRDAIARGRGEL